MTAPARRTALLSLALAASTACVGPARTYSAYEADAVATAEEVGSAASTAVLAVDTARSGKITANYLTVVLVEAEDSGSSAQAQFESVQPPGGEADDLSARLVPMMDEANSVLTELRVAVRRSDLTRLPSIAGPLPRLIDELDRFSAEHER